MQPKADASFGHARRLDCICTHERVSFEHLKPIDDIFDLKSHNYKIKSCN